jgi:6-pyruvoyltetrahydropterin/6-carboxytetrahydropterin synthase
MCVFTLGVKDAFSAAHRLEDYHGKCEALHGHNYAVEALFCGNALGSDGLLIDFTILKGYLKTVSDGLDHRYLNELPFFRTRATSSENLAAYIFGQLKDLVKEEGVSLQEVRVWESDKAYAGYSE